MRYFAKPNTWFKEGTEVRLVQDDMGFDWALFCGTRVCQNPESEGSHFKIGDEYEDEEICEYGEFEQVDS